MHPERAQAPHAPMHQFSIAHGELQLGGLPLSQLAARVGQTPFYAYDRALLDERVQTLRRVLPLGLRLHYALKANPMPALVAHMARLVDGMDVASAGELKTALDAGTSPQDIGFAGPGKRDSELRQAVAAGVLVHIESEREIALLEAHCNVLGQGARMSLRINPDFELKGSGMKMGGGSKPFGVDVERVPTLLTRARRAGLVFEGFHLYAGSQNLQASAICEAQQKSYALALRLADYASEPLRSLNLGGGFGIPYFPGEERLALQPIADNLAQLQERALHELTGAALVLELGRYLVGEAGIYVTRVLDRKLSRGQVFLVCDGGMHQHLAASGHFGQVLRKNYPVAIGNRMDETFCEVACLVGPLCTPLDLLADHMLLPQAHPGDLAVVFQSGAYGASASPQQFLGHPPCLEVLV